VLHHIVALTTTASNQEREEGQKSESGNGNTKCSANTQPIVFGGLLRLLTSDRNPTARAITIRVVAAVVRFSGTVVRDLNSRTGVKGICDALELLEIITGLDNRF